MVQVKPGARFKRQAKKLENKYPNIIGDLEKLTQSLHSYPQQGAPLGMSCYKVRFALSDKNVGKSGGGRVITCVKLSNDLIVLLAIYDKSEDETMSKEAIMGLLKDEGLI